MSRDAYNYKRKSKKAAKELFYPSIVLVELENAKTIEEIDQIMTTARKRYL